MILLLSQAALAAPLYCGYASVIDSIPVAGAVDVPVDTHPSAVLSGCQFASSYHLEVLDEGTVLASGDAMADSEGDVLTLDAGTLPANTDLVFRITPADAGEVAEIGFTTGEATLSGIQGVPSLLFATDPVYYPQANYVDATIVATPAVDPDGLSIVRLWLDDFPYASVEGNSTLHVMWVEGSAGTTIEGKEITVCVGVDQLAGNGDVVVGDDLCDTLPYRRGCAVAPGSGLAGLVGMLSLLARRRR